MIDENNNFVNSPADSDFEQPPPAHFDEVAAANAQPVQPLSRNRAAQRIQMALRSARSARPMFAGIGAALALVVICGLAAGAVAGIMLMTERQHADTPAAAEESAVEVDAAQDATKEMTQNADARPVLAEVALPATVKKSKLRVRTLHGRSRGQHGRKAYRVAVIR